MAQRPDLLDLLLRTFGRPGLSSKVVAADSTLRIANPLEVRPDLVLVAEGERGPWVIVDVQLKRDDDKQRRWLAAVGVLLDPRGMMGDVIVMTHDASVAVWAQEIARVVGPAGTRLVPEPLVVKLTFAEVELPPRRAAQSSRCSPRWPSRSSPTRPQGLPLNLLVLICWKKGELQNRSDEYLLGWPKVPLARVGNPDHR